MARRAATVLGLAVLILAGCSGSPEGSPTVSGAPDVLLIVIDTIRADHMGAYGYGRNTTPNIDELAESGVIYLRAHSQAPWTTPSMGSLLTSNYPTTLGIRDVQSALPDDLPLLQEVLRQAGYTTGGVVSHSFCSAKWGFARGFDVFDESNVKDQKAVTSPGVTDRAIEFLDSHRDRPKFLLLHYFDPHIVYLLHEGFEFDPGTGYRGVVRSGMKLRELWPLRERLDAADLDELQRIYDSEIALTDHHIGRLFDRLRELGLWDRTLIVVTGDHGEEFLDHGQFGHAKTLYEELLHVPLIIKYPGGSPTVVEPPVGLIDVYPTILDVLGLAPPATLRGRSLLDRSRPQDPSRPVFAETSRLAELRAVIAGRHKLIYDLRHERVQLFDVYEDPGDRRDLSRERPERVRELAAQLNDWLESSRRRTVAPRVELTDEERERLRALGYETDPDEPEPGARSEFEEDF